MDYPLTDTTFTNSIKIVDAEKALKTKDKISVPFPFPRPPKDANYKLQYDKPAHINAVGSYPLNTAIKHGDDLVIDFVVTMPAVRFLP
jgi:U3 small nucleolar RNA-associated protein 22